MKLDGILTQNAPPGVFGQALHAARQIVARVGPRRGRQGKVRSPENIFRLHVTAGLQRCAVVPPREIALAPEHLRELWISLEVQPILFGLMVSVFQKIGSPAE